MENQIYNIKNYTDRELLQILDLDHPTDRELEAKIIQLMDTYKSSPKMYLFFQEIYQHFFDIQVEENEDEQENDPNTSDVEDDHSTGPIIENFETNQTTQPKQLDTKATNNQIVTNKIDNTIVSTGTTNAPTTTPGFQYQKQIEFPKGATNPILKETIQRVITIDSQFRDIGVYPFSTDFTFNLSETLYDVVSMKLYSVQIPYTWYTINNAYGSNFFYIKGNSPGITNGYYDYKISIASGNYQITDLTNAVHNSMKNTFNKVTDIDFGQTDICYSSVNGRASFIFDIKQIYNEYNYYLKFPTVIPPQIPIYYIQYYSTPYIYLKSRYLSDNSYKLINDISINIPPPAMNSINNSPTHYGYDGPEFVSIVNKILLNTTTLQNSQIVQDDQSNNTLHINVKNLIPQKTIQNISNYTIEISSQVLKQFTPSSGEISSVEFDSSLNYYSIGDSLDYSNNIIESDIPANILYNSPFQITIKPIGKENNEVPNQTVTFPPTNQTLSCPSFCQLITKYINDPSFNAPYQMGYNISLLGTQFFMSAGQQTKSFVMDVSVSTTLTNKYYDLYLYDPSGYKQDSSNDIWSNVLNIWNQYIHVTDPSYSLYDSSKNQSITDISFGYSPSIEPKSTAIITDINQINSLTELFGFSSNEYYYNEIYSAPFSGSNYNSNYQFPTITVDPSNQPYQDYYKNSIEVHQYQTTTTYSNGYPITRDYQYYQQNQITPIQDVSWSLGYQYIQSTNNTSSKYSYYNIIQAINQSIQSQNVFTSDSRLWIVDQSLNDVSASIMTQLNNQSIYKFKLHLKLDRRKTTNATNMKLYIKLNDPIWTSLQYFNFQVPTTNEVDASNNLLKYYEISDVNSESVVASNNISFVSKPYVNLRSIKPGYCFPDSSFGINDISFSVEPPKTQQGYSNTQYLNAINEGMQSVKNLGLIASINNTTDPLNKPTLTFNINYVIPQTDTSGNGNFIVDFSETFMTVFKSSESSWKFNSRNNIFTIGDITVSTVIYLTHNNNKIYITSQGKNQSLRSVLEIPFNDPSKDQEIYTIQEMFTKINDLFTTTKATSIGTLETTNDVSLYGSTMYFDLANQQIIFNLSIRTILQTNDYQVEFCDPSGSYPGIVWKDDLKNTWVSGLHLSDQSYNFIDNGTYVKKIAENTYTITGTLPIKDKNLLLTTQNNYFTLIPIVDLSGGVYSGTTENDIKVKLSLPVNQYYTSIDVIEDINKQFSTLQTSHGTVLYGSNVFINNQNKITIRLNINTIYTAKDYVLDFYDPVNFTHCTFGTGSSIQTVTWDTTLGWILGFRTTQIYALTPENVSYNPSLFYTYYSTYVSNVYTYDISTNIAMITGDTSINVNLYSYFLIILDDYVQNHLNDGLVTITSSVLDVPLNSYSARSTAYRCSQQQESQQTQQTKQNQYIGNFTDPVTGNRQTANQLYAANQILNTEQNRIQNPYQTSLGPYIQDIFGLVPIKTAGLQNGQSYIEFGGTLQIQERTYFGPVNIKRMTIRLLTDKGNILDLNNQNWSFSFIVQQLYNPMKRG